MPESNLFFQATKVNYKERENKNWMKQKSMASQKEAVEFPWKVNEAVGRYEQIRFMKKRRKNTRENMYTKRHFVVRKESLPV